MLLEPHGGQTVRNMRVNIAGIITMILVISLSSAALAWYYAPPRTEILSTRFYQLQQQNQDLRDQAASLQGEFSLAKEQINGLKSELLSGQQDNETLHQRLNIYESILEARKSGGVRILRASARIKEGNVLNYRLVLVKGGNYPRSVRGSVRIHAIGNKGEKQLLKLGKSTAELPYKMDTHIFLEGNTPWQHAWLPEKLQITRLNYQGAERDQMEIKLQHDATKQDASTRDESTNTESTRNKPTQSAAPDTKENE
ncbi:MAG: hypothetical protein Q9M25_06010 [Mariprofundaceae bacterium]|nr:hypothetical protein [Mariprofundaceae bacterium]